MALSKNFYLTVIGSSSLKTVTNKHIATSLS